MSIYSLRPNKSLTITCLQILFFSLLIACQSSEIESDNPSSFSKELVYAELAKIDSLLSYQEGRWNEGDIDGFMDSYWNSDSLTFASGGTVRQGWTATIERYRNTYPNKSAMGLLQFGNVKKELITPELAMVLGSWNLERESGEIGGLYTLLLRKIGEPGEWKIVHDHTSSRP